MKNHRSSPSRRAWLVALLAVLCLPSLSIAARAEELAAMPAPWLVEEAQGPATVRYGRGPWQPLAAGAVVAAAAEIRTGPDARVVLVRGQDRVRLLAQSYLELPPAAADGLMTRFVHWLGTALFEVERRPAPRFAVDTPYLTAVVKGTAFSVEVSGDAAAVAVASGTVRVTTPDGAAVDLAAGRIARAYAGLSGLIVEDAAAAAPDGLPPAADSGHAWPEPTFDPVPNTLPRY